MKVGVNMKGKRPYYVITYIREYDGYDSWVEYIGTNWKAAYNRYLKLVKYVEERELLNEGVDPDEVNRHIQEITEPLAPGRMISAYVNDNNCYYMTIKLECLTTNSFIDRGFEQKYKEEFPNSKY